MKNERIFRVTFTNQSTVFIQATDEAHARRIVEMNKTWRRSVDGEPITMVIESITDIAPRCE